MPFITVGQGQSTVPDGVYRVTLTDITGPRTVTARQGPNAGQDFDLLDWHFVVNENQAAAGEEVVESTSTASGPRSKMYGYLTALFGGRTPPPGTQLEKEQLIGREAIATVATDDAGWPKITNLGAVPATMPLPVKPTDTSAVVPTAKKPAAPVAQPQADLPF